MKAPKVMTARELERLYELLGRWYETHNDDGLHEHVSRLRAEMDDEIDARDAR